MTPFTIAIAQSDVDDLKRRLAQTRFPPVLEGTSWDYGFDQPFLRRLVQHWGQEFDWRAAEARLNAVPQFTAGIDGQTIHFLNVAEAGPERPALLLLNGWPSNFVEYYSLIERLRGEFNLVVPSLIGFGFSPPAQHTGMNLSVMAHLFARLMTELGYERFLVHGTDLGAGIELSLVRNYPGRLLGAHYVNVYSQYPRPENPTPEEQEYFGRVDGWTFTEGAYAMEQGTKPDTLAVGLNDSPAGLAAWIIEKFRSWSDLPDGDIESVHDLDTLCTILSVYWYTQTIGPSVRLYKEAFADREMMSPMPQHGVKQGVMVPAACDLPAPRAWGERWLQNLVHWSEPGKGGHFPALEVPDQLAADIRAFAGKVL